MYNGGRRRGPRGGLRLRLRTCGDNPLPGRLQAPPHLSSTRAARSSQPRERRCPIRTIVDEFRTTWFVEDKEDPAGPLCKALDKAGFQDIVLPRQAILTGEVPSEVDSISREAAFAALSLIDGVNKTVRKELVKNAEHQAVVFLCWRYLAR